MQRTWVCGLLAAVALPLCLAAYQLSPSSFHIAIIDGEGAMNNIKGRVAQEPIVQVQDEHHQPVKGAYVTFDSPKAGPSAAFAGGVLALTVVTNELGEAAAHGFKPNNVTGSFEIHVHVMYQGQPIGDAVIHQVNVSGPVADLSRNLETGAAAGGAAGAALAAGSMGPGVLGVVMGPSFQLNGATVPDNANLTANAQVMSLDKTIRIHLSGDCDYLLAPMSQAQIQDHKLILERGRVRVRHNGTCHVAADSYLISGDAGADGVIGYSAGNLQVASLSGTLQVTGAQGTLAGTVAPGAYSTFGVQSAASGATAGGPSGATATGASGGVSAKTLAIYSGALGVSLAGLGLAVDAILQPGSSSTSP